MLRRTLSLSNFFFFYSYCSYSLETLLHVLIFQPLLISFSTSNLVQILEAEKKKKNTPKVHNSYKRGISQCQTHFCEGADDRLVFKKRKITPMTVPNRWGRKLMHMSTTDVKLIRYCTTLHKTETTDGVFRIRGDVAR